MNQRRNRKKELARRTLVYALMTATLVVALCVLLFTMLGYRFNPTTREVEQAGLVQYNSFPRGATVAVDSANLEITPTKNMVMPGQHQFSMKLTGYESWQKTVMIRSDTVTQLDYARLVPSERKISTMRDMTGVETTKFAPGGRYMLGIGVTAESRPMALWGDVRSADAPRFSEQLLDTTLLAGYDDELHHEHPATTHSYLIHAWDGGGRFVIVQHRYTVEGESMQTQWIRLDRDKPKEIVDISRVVGFAMRDVKFGSSGDNLYVLQENGDVRQVRLGDSTISRPLLTGVEKFSLHGTDTVAFVGVLADAKVAGIWRENWKTPQIIRTLTAEERDLPLRIDVSEYYNKDTVVVNVGDMATIYRGTLPGSEEALMAFLQTGRKIALGRTATDLSVSDNGRFVVLRDYAGFISYDLERMSLSAEIALRGDTQLRWLDGFHLWHVDETGNLLMQEFDGANPYKLLPAAASHDVTLSSDGKFVYGLLEKDGVLELRRLAMTVK